MDVNSRINWMPGMEISAQTFISLSEELDFRQQMALHAALGSNRRGLLPGATFINNGCFVKNRFEIERFRCLAVLPSGKLIDVDEPVEIVIPMLYGNEYYLAVGLGDTKVEFEKEGIPYIRPQYDYSIKTLEEIEQGDFLPVVRFKAENGVFSIDTDFIPPCLMLAEDVRFQTYLDGYIERLLALVNHANLEEGEGKRAFLRYIFRMKGYGTNNSVQDYILLIQEIVQAVDYYIATPHLEQAPVIPQPSPCDVQKWLSWTNKYLDGATSILDTVVLEDKSIDYEALLEQAKKELYERLNPELYDKLLLQIKKELREELQQHLTDTLTTFITEVVKPELCNTIEEDLYQKLYQRLFDDLYQRLYDALYVPTPKEKEFIPII